MANITYLHGGIGKLDIEGRRAELNTMLGIMYARRQDAEAEFKHAEEMIAQIKGGLIEAEMWLARISGGSGPAAAPEPEADTDA